MDTDADRCAGSRQVPVGMRGDNWPMPGPRIRCVGAIITDDTGRLLLIQRGHEPEEGRWSLPGGRVRPGESDPEAVDALVRRFRSRPEVSENPRLRQQFGVLMLDSVRNS